MGRMAISNKALKPRHVYQTFNPNGRLVIQSVYTCTYNGYGNVAESLPSMKFVEPC